MAEAAASWSPAQLAAFKANGIEIPRPQRVILSRDPGAFPPPDEGMADPDTAGGLPDGA